MTRPDCSTHSANACDQEETIKPQLNIRKASIFAEGLDHPECVVVHTNGTVYAGGEAGQIYEISPDGSSVREIANTGGGILGVAISPDGSWLAACDVKKRVIWWLDLRTRKLKIFSDGVKGHAFQIPNHLVFATDGRLFVTESGSVDKASGKILCFDSDHSGRGYVWHAGPFKFANGIALWPDQSAIALVSSLLPGVERIEMKPDGKAGRRRVLVRIPKTVPDGLLVDKQGNVLIACYTPCRIYILSPTGELSILIDDWFAHTLSNPTNIAFADASQTELLAANLGRWHLTRIPVNDTVR